MRLANSEIFSTAIVSTWNYLSNEHKKSKIGQEERKTVVVRFQAPAIIFSSYSVLATRKGDFFYEFNLLDDEADSQTEGEELDRARQERMREVKLKPLPYLQTDTETEVNL